MQQTKTLLCAVLFCCAFSACGEDTTALEEQFNPDDGNTCGVAMVADSCIESNCAYEWKSCESNCECVRLRACRLACMECSDCDEGDCRDGCDNEHRTGTAQTADIAKCLQDKQVCPDSVL